MRTRSLAFPAMLSAALFILACAGCGKDDSPASPAVPEPPFPEGACVDYASVAGRSPCTAMTNQDSRRGSRRNPRPSRRAGPHALIADGSNGLEVVDVSTREDPRIVAQVPMPAKGVSTTGAYTYVACGEQGLRIVDTSDPVSPVVVGTVDVQEDAMGVAVSGGWAYVADGDSGIQVVDVSVPEAAAVVARSETPGSATAITFSANHVYAVGNFAGIHVVDVSDPMNPRPVGASGSMPKGRGLVVSGG